MKYVMSSLLLICISSSSFAMTLFCNAVEGFERGPDVNRHILIKESIGGTCTHKLNLARPGVDDLAENDLGLSQVVYFRLDGFGPGLSVQAGEFFTIICPTVKFANITKNPFFGIKAEAGFIAGADAGLFANKRGGACLVLGASAGSFGASVVGAKLRFYE